MALWIKDENGDVLEVREYEVVTQEQLLADVEVATSALAEAQRRLDDYNSLTTVNVQQDENAPENPAETTVTDAPAVENAPVAQSQDPTPAQLEPVQVVEPAQPVEQPQETPAVETPAPENPPVILQ